MSGKNLTIPSGRESGRQRFRRLVERNWRLYILLLPGVVWVILFMYAPLYGATIAFRHFNASLGIMNSPWAGLEYFRQFFSTRIAFDLIRNTVLLSFYSLLFGFPVPIIFALLLNQLPGRRFRKAIQTISYAPFFISNVVVVSMMMIIFAPGGGFVNVFLQDVFGFEPILFMSRPEYFRSMFVGSGIWQTMGFSAIIYIAALAGVSPEYHEAAIVDGASKFKRILYVDLPLIRPTIVIMFILAIGSIMTIGWEKAFLMQSSMNLAVSEIISTYVYKTGLLNAQFSFATAVGLFNSTVNFILLLFANALARKYSDVSIF